MSRLLAEEVLASAKTVSNTTLYSDSTKFRGSCTDAACVKITTTAGQVTVTQQVSLNNIDWYDAVSAAGSALGAVVANMTVGTKYIQYTPVMAPYIRYKLVENGTASANVTLTLVYQEDTV